MDKFLALMLGVFGSMTLLIVTMAFVQAVFEFFFVKKSIIYCPSCHRRVE